ncbi:translocation/assembly module TamB domain-containing protein [Flavitalea flava]
MHTSQAAPKPHKSVFRRLVRVFFKIFGTILLILIIVIFLIQSPFGQNIIRSKAEKYLSRKLNTRIGIGKLSIRFPKTIVLGDIYIEDRQKDTLFSGGLIQADLRMWGLLHNKVDISSLELKQLTVKVKRPLPDTTFNFQFIVDAFAGAPEKEPVQKTGTPMEFSLKSLVLDSIRIVYKDGSSGNDMEAWIGHSQIKDIKFDPSGASPLGLGAIELLRSRIGYANTVSGFFTNGELGSLTAELRSLDLSGQRIDLKEIHLDSTTLAVRIGKSVSAGKTVKTVKGSVVYFTGSDWHITAGDLQLNTDNIRFDDDNQPHQGKGMDYGHLKMDQLSLHINQLLYNRDSISGNLSKGQFRERSGFQLLQLQTRFLYTNRQTWFKDLVLRTPGTLLQRTAIIQYSSLAGLMKDPSRTVLDLDLFNNKIQVKDILLFVPDLAAQPVFRNPNEIWLINGRVKGTLSALRIETLQFSGLKDIKADLSGTVQDLSNPKTIAANLDIRTLSGSRNSLSSLLPPRTLPENIAIPDRFNLQGKLEAGMVRVKTDLKLTTSSGLVTLKGTLSDFRDPKRTGYDLILHTKNLDLGFILKDSANWGPVTAEFTAKGKSLDPDLANAVITGHIGSALIRKYAYHDLLVNGSIANRHLELQSSVNDAAIHFDLKASADLDPSRRYPAIHLDWQIDTLDLLALHLLKDTLQLKGHMLADFADINPDSLQGSLKIVNFSLTNSRQTLVTDSIRLLADRKGDIQTIRLYTEMADLDLNGRYKLSELGQALQHTLNHYYRINGFKDTAFTPQDWQMHVAFRPSPMVLAYIPSLKGTDSLGLNLSFNSDRNDLHLAVVAPRIQYGKQIFRQASVTAATEAKRLQFKVQVQDASGSSFKLYQTSLYGYVTDDKLISSLLAKDDKGKERYRLSGELEKEQEGLKYILNPDSLLLNYDKWQVSRDNFFRYDSAGLVINDFKISHGDESLRISSDPLVPASPLDISFTNFKIATLTKLADEDSLLVGGVLNGKATVKELLTNPVFTSDLQIKDLSYQGDSIGDLTLKVNNEKANAFSADIALEGHRNDVRVKGEYYTGEGRMDMKLDLMQLNLASIRPFAKEQLEKIEGILKGNLAISGTMEKPVVNGRLHFDSATLTPSISGEPLKLSNDNIEFDADGFNFNHFSFQDADGNKATLDGNVYTADLRDYEFDLSLNANDFRLVNAEKNRDRQFYGKLNLDAAINLTGDKQSPIVDGDLRINKKTDFTFVLQGTNPEVVSREGVVRFVIKNILGDTSVHKVPNFLLPRNTEVEGMEIGLNIETDSSANFTMVIDERNGDALTARGRSNLVFGIDKSGKMSLTGGYEVESGSYNLSLELLKRKFEIQRGSTITWTGDPTTATLDITATYTAVTPSIDLVANEVSGRPQSEITKFKQKLPFFVTLKMEGELLKPQITFDISLPPNVLSLWPDVDARLQQIRGQGSELNKQVFALLLLNRFIGEDPLQSAAGGGIDVGNIAFQSASQILTNQLDQLAASLIKGVDIHFDLNNQQDFTTGQQRDYTELNVTVSKKLFNDRIQVNVGSNFDVQGTGNTNQSASNIAGDVAVDYRLTKDGRYMIRAYRKNQYEAVVEGQVVESGVSFILTLDYNKFREIFASVKKQQLEERNITKPKAGKKANP